MLVEINKKIRKIKDDIILKKVLEKKLDSLEKQLENDLKEIGKLEKELKKEHKDVEKLEKISFANIIATVMKNKDERLEKEQQEYLMAKIKYDDFSSKLMITKENISDLKSRIAMLNNSENEYKHLLNKKLELIRSYGNEENKEELARLEEEIDSAVKNKKEIEEAEAAGRELLNAANAAKSSLESAKNWGLFDIAGGDFISSMAKHNKINDAEEQFSRMSSLLGRFNKELGDINIQGLSFSSTTIAFDIFFDNIFTDLSVQNKINDSLESVKRLIDRVENILSKLKNRKQSINSELSNLRKEYDSKIESI